MVLRSSQGEIVLGRCGATNLCTYCARLSAVENAEVLSLDAMSGIAPTLYGVLTTSSTDRNPRTFYRAREQVGKALRRRWPDCQWAVQVEFTTGTASTSGGHRRQHWNWLLKGIDVDDQAQALDVMSSIWCARTGGTPEAQYLAPVAELGGLMRYLSLHFAKPAQAPPVGWRGHRFLHSRGYFDEAMPAVREKARDALRLKRELWKASQRGADSREAELQAHEAVALAKATTWTFTHLRGALATRPEAEEVRKRAQICREEWDQLDADLAVADAARRSATYFLGEARRCWA